MSILRKSTYLIFATPILILAGCGGSGSPLGTSSVSTELSIPVQPASGVAGGAQNTVTDAVTDIATTNNTEIDQSDMISPVLSDTSGVVVVDASAEGDTSSNNSDTAVASGGDTSGTNGASIQTYPNSVCAEPGVTSVSFEDYTRSRNAEIGPQGVYVPFPASGFGWDGTEVCDLEGSQALDEIEVLVPYVAQRPDTDGDIALREWIEAANAGTYNYETKGNDVDNLLLSPVPEYQDGAGYTEWWAMHDGTNLYLRIRVSNDSLTQVFSDSDNPWDDDSVEIYIDGDNSKGDTYDGVNDFQVVLTADNERLPILPGDAPDGLRIFHRSGGDYTYNIEVSINLASAGIEIGRPFGFDIHINEDDNGNERDAKWGWFEKSGFDRSWHQPSAFGTLLLTDCADRNQCGRYQTLSP